MDKPKVTIYSTEFCGYCKLAKQFLDDNNVAYKNVDVSEDEQAQKEMIEASNQMGVPVIVVGEGEDKQVLVGFQKEKLAELLKI
jgi:glutaredoxin-like YruB-family protein